MPSHNFIFQKITALSSYTAMLFILAICSNVLMTINFSSNDNDLIVIIFICNLFGRFYWYIHYLLPRLTRRSS